jgi:hypothetical protein
MELNSPWVLYIGIPLVLLLCFIKLKKSSKEIKAEKKVANTEYIKETELYKKLLKRYKIFKALTIFICSFSLILSLVLIARPVETQKTTKDERKKDIFLCMDVSGSMNGVNERICTYLKNTVAGLKGDKFGIVLFNSSATVAVPLTDDLHYVENTLNTLRISFNTSSEEFQSLDVTKRLAITNMKIDGTMEGKGSSIIPDSLATCAYDFPDADKERTRIIILSTDNDLAGDSLLTIAEACKVCKNKDIVVYAISPEYVVDELIFKNAIASTGGKFYKATKDKSVDEIIRRNTTNRNKTIRSKDAYCNYR